jgi:hypothetical protein
MEIYHHFDDIAQDVVMANASKFITPAEPGAFLSLPPLYLSREPARIAPFPPFNFMIAFLSSCP